MNTEDDEFARIEREQAMRGVPDANHNITFHNQDGKQVGTLDFNGPEMVFTGDADESAKVFFDFIAKSFKARLDQERAEEREACAKVCESQPMRQDVDVRDQCAAAIRNRGNKA